MAGIAMGIIDGTGALKDSTYAQQMQHSFPKQIADALGEAAYYQQGPWIDGSNDAFKMYRTVDWLRKQHEKDSSVRLMLAGYSRGAWAVMCAAAYMKQFKLKIDSLFLFDAVAHDLLAYSSTVSDNVTYCRHARRSQDPAFVAKYESYIINSDVLDVKIVNPVAANVTRPYFLGVGKSAAKGVNFRSCVFTGSHGALGGVGWKKVREDWTAQPHIAAWMNAALAERGVKVSLKSFSPSF